MSALRALRDLPAPELLAELLRSGRLKHAPQERPDSPGASVGREERALSSGSRGLDAALGGGLFRGELSELVAAPSAGGTSLVRAALAAAARAGELCALVDLADALDPRGAREAGLELQRLLWVRPTTLAQALRACELLSEARFGLIALDLGELRSSPARAEHRPSLGMLRGSGELQEPGARPWRPQREREPRPGAQIELVRFAEPHQQQAERKLSQLGPAPWARLSRRVERNRNALLVLSRTAQAGSFAASTVELGRSLVRWEGAPQTAGRLLTGLGIDAQVVRARHAPPSRALRLRLDWRESA